MDKIIGYSDWERMIVRTKQNSDGKVYAEGFNPESFNWNVKVDPSALFDSISLTAEEVEARLAEIQSSAESS